MRRFYRTFGSLKLAVVLLASFAGTLIFSTFYESKTSTREVQMLVYQSWWFIGMLILLGVNVFCAAMSRYPWKGYQTGFVITHLGIITLLIGSIIGLLFGVEGNVTMMENGPPRAFLAQDFEVVQIARQDKGLSASVPIGLDHRALKPGEVRRLKTGKLGLEIGVTARHANSKEELIVKDGTGPRNPALKFSFSSKLPGMEQSGMHVSEWLVASDPNRKTLSINPAKFRIEAIDDPALLAQRLRPPQEKKASSGKGTLKLVTGDQELKIPVEEYLDHEFKSPDGKTTVKLEEYFADLRIVDKKPVSVSDEPKNPAIFFSVTTEKGKSKGFGFADYPDMNMIQGEAGPDKATRVGYEFERPEAASPGMGGLLNTVTVLVGPDNKLYYTSDSARSGFHSGELQIGVGQLISTNSPMKPEFKVEEFHARPEIVTKYVPDATNEMTQFIFPAIELELKAGGQSTNVFVRWGDPKAVTLGGIPYELTYGWSTVPLDFSLQLERFEMPKYEGTEDPSGYESYVKVKDAKTGEEFSRKIWMNNPMTYHGYRLSQASFDAPKGEGETYRSTLQVLKDPGWFFKWTGSLLIVLGIITMFYLKPYFKGLQKERAKRAASVAHAESALAN
jgi:hypothetical protein